MMNIPVELYHPMIVHFPIALLTVGSIFYIFSFHRLLRWLQQPAVVMGVIGTGAGWLAKFTGEKAAGIVGTMLCNQTLLAKHEQQAETALIFFSVTWALALLAQLTRGKLLSKTESPFWWKGLLTLGLLLGSTYLVLAGHKGSLLVFEEGAAVRSPIQSCAAPK